MPELIFDTTVLSNFAVVGQISLLEQLYRRQACTTLMVLGEILQGLDAGYDYLYPVREAMTPRQPNSWLTVLPIDSVQAQVLYSELSSFLGAGEASCLALAITQGLTLASDDLAARRVAAERGVRLTGTVGILIRLVRESQLVLAEANGVLKRMIALRYRSPVKKLDDLI